MQGRQDHGCGTPGSAHRHGLTAVERHPVHHLLLVRFFHRRYDAATVEEHLEGRVRMAVELLGRKVENGAGNGSHNAAPAGGQSQKQTTPAMTPHTLSAPVSLSPAVQIRGCSTSGPPSERCPVPRLLPRMRTLASSSHTARQSLRLRMVSQARPPVRADRREEWLDRDTARTWSVTANWR